MTMAQVELWYDEVLVGNVLDPYESEGVWYGTSDIRLRAADGATARRVADFVEFSLEWNAKAERQEDPDAAEFDQYSDIINSGRWRVKVAGGVVFPVDQAPIFAPNKFVSYMLKASE